MIVDAVFDKRTGYHVVTKPAGWFNKHPKGEGSDLFVIIRGEDKDLAGFEALDKDGNKNRAVKLDLKKTTGTQVTSGWIFN